MLVIGERYVNLFKLILTNIYEKLIADNLKGFLKKNIALALWDYSYDTYLCKKCHIHDLYKFLEAK